ncbi:MAG: ATP-binding protein [Solirubrobacteraceae bacterium]
MSLDRRKPDLAIVLPLDPYAPRAARHRVAQIGRPSPDLRDAIKLLCSELVTQAVEHAPQAGNVELRMWMPEDLVRVELESSPATMGVSAPEPHTFASLLLNQIADRWALDVAEDHACIWYEIDRHAAAVTAGTR